MSRVKLAVHDIAQLGAQVGYFGGKLIFTVVCNLGLTLRCPKRLVNTF